MRRHRPDPDQGLFPWVWKGDDGPEPEADDEPEPAPPPLRARVVGRNAPRVVTLWGAPVVVRKAPTRPSETQTTGTRAEMYPLKPGRRLA